MLHAVVAQWQVKFAIAQFFVGWQLIAHGGHVCSRLRKREIICLVGQAGVTRAGTCVSVESLTSANALAAQGHFVLCL